MKEPKAQDDTTLIQAVIAGDKNAFDKLVMRYKDCVFSLCYRIMSDYDEADECAQEVFIKMYKNITSFRGEASFPTWLYRIAVNTCKNRLIYNKRRMAVSLNSVMNGSENPGTIQVKDTSYDPSRAFDRSEKQERIYQALNELPPRERVFIVLKDMEGKTYEEIAVITGTREGTVKSTLARTRKKMRNMLKDIFP